MKRITFLISVVLLLPGCINNKIPKAIDSCVRSRTNPVFKDLYGESTGRDFYKMIQEVEELFIESGELENDSKESYLKLTDKIYNKYELEIFNEVKIKEYSDIIGLMIIDVVSSCPTKVVVNYENDLSSSIVKQFFMSQELMKSGYSYLNVKEYINQISGSDFNLLTYRAPILTMILFEIKNKSEDQIVFPDMPEN